MRRRQFLKLTLGGAAALKASALAAWPLADVEPDAPQLMRLRYRVSERGTALGEATVKYRIEGDQYRVTSHVEPTGRVARLFSAELKESSAGRWQNGRAEPQSYSYQRSGLKSLERSYQFDYQAGQVEVSDREPLPMSCGVQDEVSHLLTLSQALQCGAEALELQVLYGSKARIYDYRFKTGPLEALTLADRQWQARKVTRTTSRGKYQMTLWCAPELGYLPIRQVRVHNETGARSELELLDWRAG